jgi:hypothetical protein
MFVEEIAIPRTRSRRRTLPPILQAAALYEHRVPPPPPVMQRLAALGERIAELRTAIASLQARLDATASARRDR